MNKEYADKMPNELKRAIKAMDAEARQAIIAALAEHEELSFSELKREISIDQSNLRHHLNILMKGALVENFIKGFDDSNKYSFYKITKFGKYFLEALYDFLERLCLPPKVEEISYPSEDSTLFKSTGNIEDLGLSSDSATALRDIMDIMKVLGTPPVVNITIKNLYQVKKEPEEMASLVKGGKYGGK